MYLKGCIVEQKYKNNITGSTTHFRTKPVNQMLWGKMWSDLTLPVRSNPDFPSVSILELKVYGLLLHLREDFINSFLDFDCLSYCGNNFAIVSDVIQ